MRFPAPAKGVVRLKVHQTDFSMIRKSLVILFLIAVVIPAAAAPSAEAKSGAIPGGPCSKVGKTLNYKGKKLICKRSGSRLRWAKVSSNGKKPVSTTLPKTQGSSNGKKPVSTTLPKTQGSSSHPYSFVSDIFGVETPITWSCDAVITVQMNVEQLDLSMRLQALQELQSAIDEINSHARLKFVIDGTTSEMPASRPNQYELGFKPNNVIFAFLYPDQSDVFLSEDSALSGRGGSGTIYSQPGEPFSNYYGYGNVVINLNQLKLWGPGTGIRSRRSLYLHEMLHVVGLDHVMDPQSVMSYSRLIGKMGPGDVAGVKALGAFACGS